MRRILLLLTIAALATGCSRSPRVTFYTLEPAGPRPTAASAPAAKPAAATRSQLGTRSAPAAVSTGTPTAAASPVAAPPPRVAVGPVTLPELVDRPQLVVRVGENRVEVLEMQRWAEPLKSGIVRVIAEDLRRLLGPGRVYSYQEHLGGQAECRVLLDVERFEARAGQGVQLQVAWTVVGAPGSAPRTGRFEATEAAGGDYDTLVAAYSRALKGLSDQLAQAIMKEPPASR